MKNQLAVAALVAFTTAGLSQAEDATIHVQANEIVSRPSPESDSPRQGHSAAKERPRVSRYAVGSG